MAHPALLLLFLSGFVITLLDGWGPLYRANLILHPLLGLGFTVLMYYFAWRRFALLKKRFSVLLWVGIPIAGSVVLTASAVTHQSAPRAYGFAYLLAAFLCVGLFRLFRAVAPSEWVVACVNYGGFGLWTLNTLTGLSVLLLSQRTRVTQLLLLHRTIAIAFTALYVCTILLSFTNVFARSREFADEQPSILTSLLSVLARGRQLRHERPRAWSTLLYALGAASVLAGLTTLDRWADATGPSFTVPVSTIPFERRADDRRVDSFADARVPPAAVDLTDSCQECHAAITDSARTSNHAFSTTTPHFQRSLGLLRSELGPRDEKTCQGCHVPAALFGAAVTDGGGKHNELSCSFCHMVRDASTTSQDGTRQSTYTLHPPLGHIGLFLADGREHAPGALNSFLIRLSPLNHGRQFRPPLLATDGFCEACHAQQIPPEPQTNLIRPRCIDCHMRPLDEVGSHGTERSHLMPGANVDVPHFAGREDAAALVSRWIAGDFPFSIAGWENRGWERLGGRKEATWLWMLFKTKGEPLPGEDFSVDILTANVGMGHAFPAAPLDLIDVWLEVTIRDAGGQLILANGQATADGHIPADAHRLGGRVLGDDGQPIEHYRVWRPEHDVPDRVLAGGRTTTDTYAFHVPADVKGPLSIGAEWKYRKLNRDFVDWAYGPATPIPAVSVGSLQGTLQLAGTPTAAVTEVPAGSSRTDGMYQ